MKYQTIIIYVPNISFKKLIKFQHFQKKVSATPVLKFFMDEMKSDLFYHLSECSEKQIIQGEMANKRCAEW